MHWSGFRPEAWNGAPPVLVAAGDPLLTGAIMDKAKAALARLHPDRVEERLDAPDKTLSDALALFAVYGLWGERRVVEYHAPKLGAKDRELLAAAAQGPGNDNFLLVRLGEAPEILESGPAGVQAVDCRPPRQNNPREMKAWIAAQAATRGLMVSTDGLDEMLERLGAVLGVLDGALTLMELSARAKETWDAAAVAALFGQEAELGVFTLADALAERNLAKARAAVADMARRGTKAPELVGGLRYHMRNLIMLKDHAEWTADRAWSALRLPKARFQALRDQAGRFQSSQLRRLFADLYELDRRSKTTGARDRDLMEDFALRAFVHLGA